MPTVLFVKGWRFFFYANERGEPIHVHCRKAEAECKYWLLVDEFDLEEAYAYGLSGRDRREVRQILFEHFEQIEAEWHRFQGGGQP